MRDMQAMLQEDEEILAVGKQHLAAIIVPLVITLIGAAMFFLEIGPDEDWFLLLAILVGVIGLWNLISAIVHRLTTQVVLTDQRFIAESGLRPRVEMTVDIRELNRVQAKRGLFGSLLGYGTLVVTAVGRGNLRLEFKQITNVRELAEQIDAKKALPTDG